jgi:hypothetical protein
LSDCLWVSALFNACEVGVWSLDLELRELGWGLCGLICGVGVTDVDLLFLHLSFLFFVVWFWFWGIFVFIFGEIYWNFQFF